MKKLITILFCALSFTYAMAQETEAQKKLLDKMTKDACIELDKVELTNESTKQDITTSLGFAILPVFQKYEKDIKKVFNLDINNSDDARTLGEKLGTSLVYSCDKMVKITTLLMKDESFKQDLKNDNNGLISVEGQVEKTEEKEFYYIYFHTVNDEVVKLVLINPIVNFEEFKGLIKKSKKPFKINYSVKEIYSVKEQAFITAKVISSFE